MKITTTRELGEFVRHVRKYQQLTQQQLAAAAGVGLRFIVDLEKGKPTCQLAKVLAVLQMLGIKVQLDGGML